MPKISIIVPVYNVAKYIERCVTSLFEQTINDVEYIFINDCTPDNSMEILDAIVEKYHNRFIKENKTVRIVKMPTNCGLAAVRRHGIQLATGDYIIHCDSDDWVDTNLYESLYDKAMETGAEIVICPVTEEWGQYSFVRKWEDLGNSCQQLLQDWYQNNVQMYTVNKLVKKSVLVDSNILPYKGINMWEDNGLMLRVFYYAKGLAQISDSTYHYFRGNENAYTRSYGRKSIDQMLECAKLLDDFFRNKPDYQRYKKTADAIKYYARINLVTNKFSELKEYYKIFPETDYIIPCLRRNAFSSKGIIRYRFVRYHLAWLFVLIYKIALCKRS